MTNRVEIFTGKSLGGGNKRGCEEKKSGQERNKCWSVNTDEFEVRLGTVSEDLVYDESSQGLPSLEYRGIFESQD